MVTVETMRAIPKGSTVIISTGGKTPTVLAGAGSDGARPDPAAPAASTRADAPTEAPSADADTGGTATSGD